MGGMPNVRCNVPIVPNVPLLLPVYLVRSDRPDRLVNLLQVYRASLPLPLPLSVSSNPSIHHSRPSLVVGVVVSVVVPCASRCHVSSIAMPIPRPCVFHCQVHPIGVRCLYRGVQCIGASCYPGWCCLLLHETVCRIRQYPRLHRSGSGVYPHPRGSTGCGRGDCGCVLSWMICGLRASCVQDGSVCFSFSYPVPCVFPFRMPLFVGRGSWGVVDDGWFQAGRGHVMPWSCRTVPW